MKLTSLPYLLRLAGAFALLFLTNGAASAANLVVDLTADPLSLNISNWEQSKIRIRYSCVSTSSSASASKITGALDPDLELVSLTGSAHTASTSSDGTSFTFTMVNPLPAGSTGEVYAQVRFKQTTPSGATAPVSVTFSSSNMGSATSNSATLTSHTPPTGGGGGGGGGTPTGPTYTPGVGLVKTGPWEVTRVGPNLYYDIRHGNTGNTGSNAISYVVEDTLPAGTSLLYFVSDRWGGTSVPVTVRYKTNLNSSWRQVGTTPLYNTGDGRNYYWPSALGLPATEWVTALRWEYGTLPGGVFHPSLGEPLSVCAFMRDPATFVVGSKITNCATASATGYTQTSCAETLVQPSNGAPAFWAWDDTRTGPYEIGESFNLGLDFGLRPESDQDMNDPVMSFLLPTAFTYDDSFTFSGPSWDAAGKPAPKFEKLDNYRSTGRTLLRWSWSTADGNGLKIPRVRDWNTIRLTFRLKVAARTTNGNYAIPGSATFRTPIDYTWLWTNTDAWDGDGDGNITESIGWTEPYFQVQTGTGLAGLDSLMSVKGSLDADWSHFPDIAKTVPGGTADYKLMVRNMGGVLMKNLVIIDILPTAGDTGVIDLSARNSQWAPYLAGPVAAPAGATVYYSTSKNPCRTELVPSGPAGCEDPKWNATPPADITTVRSVKFDLSAIDIYPLDELTLTWPMRAPWSAPTAGQAAWNSFGYVASRGDTGESLFPSEPMKTGITIQPPTRPYYGDKVWVDANKNGLQDSGESGLNGIRVDLYKDNGDNIPQPAIDTLVSWTTTFDNGTGPGSYLFGNIGVGKFFAVVNAPDIYGISPQDQGGADDTDSDGAGVVVRGGRVAIMPVTELVDNEEDRTWDQGLIDRSGLPAVWAVAEMGGGKVMLGGRFATCHGVARNNIALVSSTGAVDTKFTPGTGFDGTVRSLAALPLGFCFVGGEFSNYNGKPANGLAILGPTGALVSASKQPDRPAVNWVGAGLTGLLFGGEFSKVGDVECGNFARYFTNNSVDTSFKTTPGANGRVNDGEIISTKVVLCGNFTSMHGVPRGGIARLNWDGSLDTTFDPGTGANGEVYAISPLEDGRIVLTGAFTSFNGTPANGSVRLNANGSVDTTFQRSALAVDSINSAD